jgi:hypothetical protein
VLVFADETAHRRLNMSGTMEVLEEGSEGCSAGEVDTGSSLPLWEAGLATLVLSFLIISTILGNALVILSVFTYRPLRIVQNFFIVSLAVADLAVAILVMPFNVAYLILGKWIFGIHLCKLWLTCDVLCCTASILNLCAIALDRFWAITDPINYAQKRTLKRVLGTIAGVWVLSGAISSPPLAGWNDWPEELEPGTPCQLTRRKGYVVYSSLGSFFVPLLIMSLVYLEIFLATRRRLRERAKQSRLGPAPSGLRNRDVDDIEESVSSETNHNEKSTPRSQAKPSHLDEDNAEAQLASAPTPKTPGKATGLRYPPLSPSLALSRPLSPSLAAPLAPRLLVGFRFPNGILCVSGFYTLQCLNNTSKL